MILDPESRPAVGDSTPEAAERRSRFESWLARGWLQVAVLLSIPAMVLLRQTNAIFPDPTFIDSWIYLGFFKNLIDFKRYLFTETYYACRMSWILPGWLINQALSPQGANYLTHLSVFYLFIFSLYSAVSRLANRKAGFVAAITCGFYPYLWSAVGSNYVDGAGIAYYMAGFALLTRAAFSDHRRTVLTLAGVFAAAAIHTNLFWCVPASLLPFHYSGMAVLQTKEWRCAISELLKWFTLGFLVLNGFLAAINFRMVGDPWFFIPSIRFLQRYGTVSVLQHYGLLHWPLYQWLKFPLVMLVAGLVVTAVRVRRYGSRKNMQAALVISHLGLLFTIFVAFEGRGTTVLTLEYYASYLIPLTFLTLGVTLPSIETPRIFGGWTIALTVALSYTWWIYSQPAPGEWAITEALALIVVIALAGLLRYQPGAAVASVLGLGLLTYSVRPAHWMDPNGRRDVFQRLMQAGSRVELERQGRPARFWYDLDESRGRRVPSPVFHVCLQLFPDLGELSRSTGRQARGAWRSLDHAGES